jgi:hypothetical protein
MPHLLERSRNESVPIQLDGDERLARAELRRQIARLERELTELFASAFPRKRIEWDVAPAGGPRLL